MSINLAKVIAGTIVALAATAADPEARYALWPLTEDDRPAATAQLSGTR